MNSYQLNCRKDPYCYLELFTGNTANPCKGIACSFEGTAARVLKSHSRFAHYAFLSRNRTVTKDLKSIITPFNTGNNIQIFSGNPNNIRILSRLLDTIPRSASGLMFIDPPGYRYLSWSTLENLAARGKNWQSEKLDLLILFPLEMALLRNLQRPECENSITRFFGNQRWEDIKRQKQVQKLSAGNVKTKLIELFKTGLFELGYRYVEDFRPAAPTREPYYHLIFASDRASHLKYIKEAWGKSRFLKCELLF